MNTENIPVSSRRLLATLLPALLGRGSFTPGRPDLQRALAGLGESLCRWLEQHQGLVLVGGNPVDPLPALAHGLADQLLTPTDVYREAERKDIKMHLAGFWRDRRLVLINVRKGLTPAEFDHLYHLLTHYAGKGLQLRNRLFEEQARGHLAHVSMVFLEDLPDTESSFSWPARVALAWVYRDLNLLARTQNLPTREKVDWREYLLSTTIDICRLSGALADYFSSLDLIAEDIDSYDKDELVFALLEHLDDSFAGELCLRLCDILARLQPGDNEQAAGKDHKRYLAAKWVARRLAEHMQEENLAGPEHLHALVLYKVLLYEEIPRQMRPRVASLQVLTSFLSNPQKYFNEVENSHSPEVLETRLWRILEMLPKLVQALRFDVARQVLDFSQRYGPTFELQKKPEIMENMMEAAAGVLLETTREQQAALMQALPGMGRTGMHVLIDLADHQNRSVRRFAIDALIKIGQPVVPVLFETLPQKSGWHYLRNMLLILAQLNAGGPKVEKLFRQCLAHPEANVRKEALPGLARLIKSGAAIPVANALDDADMEVRKRAAACLGLTGISEPQVFNRLADILAAKTCSEELAMQIIASINRLKPQPPESPELESALLNLLGTGGFLGLGGKRGVASLTMRVAVVQALGYVGSARALKVLGKMTAEQNPVLAKALSTAMTRLSATSH